MKTTLLTTAIFAICIMYGSLGQSQTLRDPNAVPTITQEQIKELGEKHVRNTQIIVMDFEGLGDSQPILEYYNGGLSGGGFGPGPNFGVTFSGPALSLIASYAGGTGNFQNEPSPSTIMYFPDADNAIMNVLAGFQTGFSFYYTSTIYSGSVEVYSGLNGSGELMATISLAPLGSLPIPGGNYNIWAPVGVSFEGVAKSVKFGGAANQIGFDDITFGSETPGGDPGVPLSNWALLISVGLIIAFFAIRMRRII
jgi:hypothetical protein